MSYYHFRASRISSENNIVFPDEIIIDDDYVTFRKARVIGYKEVRTRIASIGSVTIDKGLLFCDIVIETRGGQMMVMRGFSRRDSDEILSLLG